MSGDYQKILKQYEANIEQDVQNRIEFIREQVAAAGMKGVVVGVSGGIDSAVTAALAVKALGSDRVVGIWMPAHSNPVHFLDAKDLAEAINLKMATVHLDATVDSLYEAITMGMEEEDLLEADGQLSLLTKGNSKARMRMATLYAVAGQLGYLVIGTCNRTEIHLGYETKGGDQMCDFNPIAGLVKAQVRIMAQALGIPENIIFKAPSADLWLDQTDEAEMGFTYEQADTILLTGSGDPKVQASMDRLHQKSAHKRQMPPTL